MRSSEEFALALYQAWAKYVGDENSNRIEWDEIDEWQQQIYLDQVNTAFKYLFEHGRISAYLSATHLEELRAEYRAYLTQKNEAKR